MSNYQRLYIPNATYFFTVVAYNRQTLFSNKDNITRLKSSIKYTQKRRPFSLTAIVVLPDHLHCIWAMNKDTNFSIRWQMLKTNFSRGISIPSNNRGSKPIWQPRFWEHMIRDETDMHNHLDYIHYNPVKHGLAKSPAEWPHSSFSRFVERGYYSSDWGRNVSTWIHEIDLE